MWSRMFRGVQARIMTAATGDDGMSTAEYSIARFYNYPDLVVSGITTTCSPVRFDGALRISTPKTSDQANLMDVVRNISCCREMSDTRCSVFQRPIAPDQIRRIGLVRS